MKQSQAKGDEEPGFINRIAELVRQVYQKGHAGGIARGRELALSPAAIERAIEEVCRKYEYGMKGDMPGMLRDFAERLRGE